MKIVIDIPEAVYKCVMDGTYCGTLYEELKNGVPVDTSCDCISREAAIEVVQKWFDRIKLNGDICLDGLRSLPSVEPERKKGKWIHIVGFWECDQCHEKYMDMPTCMGKVIYEYCPMCGAKMEVDG